MWVLAYFTQDGQPVTGLSPTTLIKDVDTGLDVITGAAMGDIGDGFYRYDFSTHDPNKNYAVTCDSVTLSGVERYTYASSGEYGEVLDTIESTVSVVDIRTTLLRKIQTNRLELFDGATDNWVLYDDDAVTPLLTFSVSDKNGDIIVQCPGSPSKRSGVTGISGTQPPYAGELHYRLHSMTNPLDHYANANKLFYSDDSGDVQELSHGPVGTILASTSSGSVPAWTSLTGADNVVVTYNGGSNGITISGTTYNWQFGVNGFPYDEINNGELLFFNEAGTTTITRTAENEITISGGTGEWQFGVNGFPQDVIGNGELLFFNEAGGITITRTAENEITFSGSAAGGYEWQFGVNGFPEDVIGNSELLFFNGSDGVTVTRTAENEITFSGSTDYYTKAQITTISGDILNYVSDNYIDNTEMTTISGDIIVQIPTDYYTQGEVTTISGDIVAQIPTDFYTQSEVTTISGDIVSQIITEHNNLSGIQGGTANQRYHLTGEQHSTLTNTSGVVDASDQHIHDARYYTETEINELIGINKSGQEQVDPLGIGDTSTSVSFAVAFPNSDYRLFVSLENTVDSPSSEYAITISSKTASGFSVHYSGEMDSNNYYLNWYATTSGIYGGNYISELQDDTSPTLGGDLELGDYSIVLNTTPSSWSSPEISVMQVDWNDYGIGTPLHMKSNGHWEQCTAASGTTRMPCGAMALEAGTGSKKIIWGGLVKRGAWSWTAGNVIYVSTVDGALSSAKPTSIGSVKQAVGIAIASDVIKFNPGFNPGEINS